MSCSCKVCSLLLAVILTLGCAAAVSAQQSLTLGFDSQFGGFRWEPGNGHYIIGLGSIGENHSSLSQSITSQGDQIKVITIEHIETDVDKLQLMLGGRLYLNQLRPKAKSGYGFFAEGNLLVQKVDLEYKDYVHQENSESKDRVDTSIGIMVGYKFIFSRSKQKGVTMELATGRRFNSGDSFHDYDVKRKESCGMFCFGYTW